MAIKALFTGSFDPLTSGHLDIITRASKMFDTLVVGVIMNPQKKSLFTLEEREEMIREVTAHLPNVEVSHFSGLLADYVNENASFRESDFLNNDIFPEMRRQNCAAAQNTHLSAEISGADVLWPHLRGVSRY